MKYVFLVTGESGMEDDYETWNIKAFMDEDSAFEFVVKCNTEAQRIMDEFDELELQKIHGDFDEEPLKYFIKSDEILKSNKYDDLYVSDNGYRLIYSIHPMELIE